MMKRRAYSDHFPARLELDSTGPAVFSAAAFGSVQGLQGE